MPKIPSDNNNEPKIITSVYLPASMRDWIKDNASPMSRFITAAITEKIERQKGFKESIIRLKKDVFVLESELLRKQVELNELESRQVDFAENLLILEKTTLIRRAVDNIPYKTWMDAANDLKESKESLSTETFNRLVESIWREANE